MDIPIVNKSIHPTIIFDKLRLINMSVLPYNTATLNLQLHFIDESGVIPEDQCTITKIIVMTSEEYANWTTDDYLIQFILTKLNLTNGEVTVPKILPEIKAEIIKRLK